MHADTQDGEATMAAQQREEAKTLARLDVFWHWPIGVYIDLSSTILCHDHELNHLGLLYANLKVKKPKTKYAKDATPPKDHRLDFDRPFTQVPHAHAERSLFGFGN